MLWGYALVWPGSFLTRDPDPLIARLKFIAHYGLQTTGIGLEQVADMSAAERDRLGQFLADHDLSLTIHVHPTYFDPDPDAARRSVDRALDWLERYHALLRSRLVTTSGGGYHRFTRRPSLAEQLERLASLLPPLAAGCHQLGLPFGIENHGDYYCSDLVALCQQVPHLGIFLDTGNTYLIGEAPMPAFQAAAPYVVGTHFKDHRVRPRPDARPLHFEVGPAVLGEGDVPLRECYQLLLAQAPQPQALVMEIELIPPPEIAPLEAFEKSLAFVRSLPELPGPEPVGSGREPRAN
jgi:sugar phosphate isomerase/epimerase